MQMILKNLYTLCREVVYVNMTKKRGHFGQANAGDLVFGISSTERMDGNERDRMKQTN
jgi:hypothetical protein